MGSTAQCAGDNAISALHSLTWRVRGRESWLAKSSYCRRLVAGPAAVVDIASFRSLEITVLHNVRIVVGRAGCPSM